MRNTFIFWFLKKNQKIKKSNLLDDFLLISLKFFDKKKKPRPLSSKICAAFCLVINSKKPFD